MASFSQAYPSGRSLEDISSGAADQSGVPQTHHPVDDIYSYIVDYARERPEVCAMWAFGVGFILGWKLKPW